MAKFNVTDLILKIDGTAVAHCTEATLTINQDLPDATTKSSGGWAEHINGLRDWEVSVAGLTDYSASGGTQLADMILNRDNAEIVFDTTTSGDVTYTGTCDASSLEQGGGFEEVASWSGSLKGTGAITKGTV